MNKASSNHRRGALPRALPRVHAPTAAFLRSALLAWYAKAARKLPWRDEPDPYRVWISEVMLQQTQVARVRSYYPRFLAAFPTVRDLAMASEEDILTQWAGLGYYRRAHAMHQAARILHQQYGGTLPADTAALRSLPGFGPYTTGAVASLAFGMREPALDANALRVFGRFLGVPPEPTVEHFARELLRKGDPRALNQALMDLGATICRARNPECSRCPLARRCQTFVKGLALPTKKSPTRPLKTFAAALLRRGEELLVAKRPSSGLFAGLWELPLAPTRAELTALCRGRPRIGSPLGHVERTLTHLRLAITMYPVRGVPRATLPGYQAWKWVTRAEFDSLGMSSAGRAVASIAEETLFTDASSS